MHSHKCILMLLAALSLAVCPISAARNLKQALPGVPGTPPAAPSASVRFCVWPEGLVPNCTQAIALANGNGVTFSCVGGVTANDCLQKVAAGEADITKVGGDGLYLSGTEFNLEPLVSEFYGDRAGTNYYSVAVVPATFCSSDPAPTLASLRGLRACHTGYRRGAGWTLPLGTMLNSGLMTPVNTTRGVNTDAQTMAAFFNGTCANQRAGNGAASDKTVWNGLCTACPNACGADDNWADYDGVVRGVIEGGCDVGFTKHTTVLEVIQGGTNPQPWATVGADRLRLLCPAGGCAPVNQPGACNLGKVSAHAVVGTAAFKTSPAGAAAIRQLVAAGAQGSPFLNASKALNESTLLFQKTTEELQAVLENFTTYFTPAMVNAFTALRTVGSGPASARTRFCAFPESVVPDCLNAISLANGNGTTFTCVGAPTANECLAKIAISREADITKVGGDSLYLSGTEFNLEPLASEYYGDRAGTNYYSVALVPAAFCARNPAPTLASLRGLRACHTGYRRGAGWTLPQGTLLNSGVMQPVNNLSGNTAGVAADAQTMAAFFNGTCANQRAGNGAAGDKTAWAGLCTACPNACGADDPWADYDGVVRGVLEGGCDVGFTKHTTVLEVIQGGTNPQPWATVGADRLRLLCPAGGCAPGDQPDACNLGKVSAHAVVDTADYKASPVGAVAIRQLVAAARPNSTFLTAAKAVNATTLLFQNATVELQLVPENFTTYFTPAMVSSFLSLRLVGAGPISFAGAATGR